MKTLRTLLLLPIFIGFSHAGGVGVFASFFNSEDLGSSTGPGGKLQVDLNQQVMFDISASYHQELEGSIANEFPVKMELVPVELGIALSIPVADNRVRPYFGAGGGFYQVDLDDGNVFSSNDYVTEDVFGWYGMMGLDVGITHNVGFFLEGRYRGIEGTLEGNEVTELGDDDFDFDLSGLAFNAGLMFRW